MSESNVIHAGQDTFHETVLASPVPVLVDFWAEWCAPCRAIAPVLQDVAAARGQSLRVVKVDVDEHPDLARHYGVRSIPTLLLFQDGQLRAQHVGALRRVELDALLDRWQVTA
ncbi:MAG: thioredoxin [Pseudomonadota bacterium]|jgi:thioredoxin 1|nr:MAG: thioredoxin [Pseudomonadota bacterium]